MARILRATTRMGTVAVIGLVALAGLLGLGSAASAQTTRIVLDDFETDQGWQADPDGTDDAITGAWELADPDSSPELDGGLFQLADTPSGSQALVTDGRSGGNVGTFDIDAGVTTIRSPALDIPAGAETIEFQYYFATYTNSGSDDLFRVVVRSGGGATEVFSEAGSSAFTPAQYGLGSFDASPWAGQQITIEFSASDEGTPSLVEAAVDDLAVLVTSVPDTASIGGDVTTTTGNPVASVGVDLFTAAADGSRDAYVRSATTGADGSYSLAEVDPGSYVVTFIAAEGEEFTNGSRWFNVGVTVEAGETGTADAVLIDPGDPTLGSIGGTVTTSVGDPVAALAIDLFAANADGSRGPWLDATTSGADGSYSFGSLDAGVYVVTFIAPDSEQFTNGSQWLNVPVSLATGETVGDVDAVLVADGDPDLGSIAGSVVTTTGNPVPDTLVDLFTAAADGSRDSYLASTRAAADGTYSFTGVTPGSYVLTFVTPDGDFFTGGNRWENIGVTVAAGESVENVDAIVVDEGDPGQASIGGQVSDPAGAGIPLRVVELYTALPDGSRGDFINGAATDPDGRYSFDVQAGVYVITFLAGAGEEFVGGGQFLNVPVTVAEGATIDDVDAVLQPIGGELETRIIGQVTVLDGTASPLVALDLYDAQPDGTLDTFILSIPTGFDGTYSLDVEPDSCYAIRFLAPVGLVFDNGEPFVTISPLCPAEGETIADISAVLDLGDQARLLGRALDTDGAGVADVQVDLYNSNEAEDRLTLRESDITRLAGGFDFLVPTGCYIIEYTAPEGRTFTNGETTFERFGCVEAGVSSNNNDVTVQ